MKKVIRTISGVILMGIGILLCIATVGELSEEAHLWLVKQLGGVVAVLAEITARGIFLIGAITSIEDAGRMLGINLKVFKKETDNDEE